jgi:hypothetical protein
MSFTKRLARTLRSWATRLDPPMPPPWPARVTLTAAPGSDADDDFINDMLLRDAMFRALNRYSPKCLPAQA